MNIEYGSSKEVKCYRDFVLNPDNRNASRAFSKTFGANLMEPAKKLHDRLRKYVSAGAYNAMFGQTDNRIEIKQGCAKKLFKFDSIKFLWQPNQSFLQRPLLILHNCVKGDGTSQAMRKFSRLPI